MKILHFQNDEYFTSDNNPGVHSTVGITIYRKSFSQTGKAFFTGTDRIPDPCCLHNAIAVVRIIQGEVACLFYVNHAEQAGEMTAVNFVHQSVAKGGQISESRKSAVMDIDLYGSLRFRVEASRPENRLFWGHEEIHVEAA